jgi:hypothetical protein
MRLLGPYEAPLAGFAGSSCAWPQGRLKGVPETTTDEERPW